MGSAVCWALRMLQYPLLGDEVMACQRSQALSTQPLQREDPAAGSECLGEQIRAVILMSRAKSHCWAGLQQAVSWEQGFEHSFNAGG